jgi:hypothetical protein
VGRHIDSSGITEMAAEFKTLPRRARARAGRVVSDIAHDGYRESRRNAERSSGEHGVHYPKSFTIDRLDGDGLAWAYGPDASMPQGNMSFEGGSRNQKPHRDLGRSADLISPRLTRVTDVMAAELHGR